MLCVIPVAFALQQKWLVTRESVYIAGAFGVTLMIVGHILTNSGEQFLRNSRWHVQAYEAALWARQNLPQNAILAMTDAGMFGFFSQRAVINLDGLVNNMEYIEALKQKRFNQYLSQKGVQYYVQHAIWPVSREYESVLSGEYEFIDRRISGSDPLRLYRADEVYRSAPYYDGPYRTVFLIWRLRHNQNGEGKR